MIIEVCLSFSIIYFFLLIYFRKQITLSFIVLSSICLLSSLFAIESSNLFHLLIALEFGSISATFMVASGNSHSISDNIIGNSDNDYIKAATQYGTINFLSGAIILAAISNQSLEILSTRNDINQLMLILGIALHCGLLPVSTFFINAYSKCSNVASVFLQLFCTKAAVIVLYKACVRLPVNGEIVMCLSVLSIATVVYAMIYSFRELNIRKLVVYNTIGQLGLISLAIANGGDVMLYIIPSILYQTLLYIIVFEILNANQFKQESSNLDDSNINDLNLNDLNINSKYLLVSLLLVIVSMASLPMTFSFEAKSLMLNPIDDIKVKSFFIFSSFFLLLTVPLKILYFYLNNCRNTDKTVPELNLEFRKKLVLVVFCILLLNPVSFTSYSITSVLLQTLFFCITMVVFAVLKNKLYRVSPIKFDLDYVYNDCFIYIFSLCKKFLVSLQLIIVNTIKFEKSLFLKYSDILQNEAIEYTSFIAIGIVGLFLMLSFFI